MEKDYVEIGAPTPLTTFSIEIAKMTQKYIKIGKPYDEPCARLEFKDKLEAAQKESERIKGFVDNNIVVEYGDLDRYGAEDRFELLANLYQKASKKIDEMLEMEKEKEKEENELKRDDKKDSKA